MVFTIRPVCEQDFPRLIEMFHEFSEFEKLPESMHNSVERMQSEIDFFHCFVAENDSKEIIGYASYFYCYYTWVGKSMYLDDLYVSPDFRGFGVGSALIRKVIDLAKESNCARMRWQVSGWNTSAIDFYKKLGATVDDVEQNCDLVLG